MLYAPIIMGISTGYTLSEEDKLKIAKYRPYGIVLRTDNLNNDPIHTEEAKTDPTQVANFTYGDDAKENTKEDKIEQLRGLIKSIQEAYGNAEENKETHNIEETYGDKILVFIDQEGGRVQRIKPSNVGNEKYPSAAEFGKLYETDRELALESVTKNYQKITTELLSFGIRGNFAPVCDQYHPGITTNGIGDRAFSHDPKAVTELSIASFKAIESAGGIACFKHLPGHGRAIADSHYTLPVVKDDLEELQNTDFKILRDIAAEVKPRHAMLAHIMYPCIDDELPSTISPKMVEFIRKDLGFGDTLLITDAMNMKGITSYGTPDELAQKSLDAGCDIILDYTGTCSLDFLAQIPFDKYIEA